MRFDTRSIFEADLDAEDGIMPDLSTHNGVRIWARIVAGDTDTDRIFNVLNPEAVSWRWCGDVRELAPYIRTLRWALLFPLCDRLADALRDCLALAEQEARRRVERAKRPQTQRFEPWQDVDLVAAVADVAGPGRKRGADWWFRCPWHPDRTPSLHVSAERLVWHCFSCGRGGGVVAWRKAQEVAA